MGSIKSAAQGVASLAANIPAEKPKPIENKVAQPQVKVSLDKDGIDNPAALFAARSGFDFTSLMRARLYTIIDQSQNKETESSAKALGSGAAGAKEFGGLKPSDIFGPMPLDTSGISNPVINYYKDVIEGGKIVFDGAHRIVTDYVNSVGEDFAVEKLGEGDSIVMSEKASVAAEFGGGAEIVTELKCTKNEVVVNERGEKVLDENGKEKRITEYTGSIEDGAEFTFGPGSGGIGLKTEYKFNSVEDAAKFKHIAGKMMLGNPGRLSVTGEERDFLNQHISSVEVKQAIGVQGDDKFGIGDVVEVGAQGGTKAQKSYKIEYENGKPAYLVQVAEMSFSGTGKFGTNLPESIQGISKSIVDGDKRLSAINSKGGDIKGTITVETKIPLKDVTALDHIAILTNPAAFAMSDKGKNTIKYVGEVDAGKYGGQQEIEVPDVTLAEAKQIITKLKSDKPEGAFDNVGDRAKQKYVVYEDKGLNVNLDLKVGGVGIEIGGRAEKRDVTVIAKTPDKDATVSQ